MRRTAVLLGLAATVAMVSCDKDTAEPQPPTTPVAEAPAPAEEPKDAAAEEEAKKKAELEKKVADALTKLEENSKKKAERWTPELKEKVAALHDKKWRSTKKALKVILASEHREPGNADRDKFRHPVKTLAFFGVKPTSKVFELGQGAGWYSELLAPLLAKQGKLYFAGAAPATDDPRTKYGARQTELFVSSSGNLYEHAEMVPQAGGDAPPTLGAAGSLDVVMVFRMFHNFERAGIWDKYMPAVHAGLKDGGVLAVVQHRAAEGVEATESAKQGYLPQKWLVEKVESYGFKLEKASELNANAKDTKDHPQGVWTLPPSYALGDKDKEKYTAIGESDRATLKFVKVAK